MAFQYIQHVTYVYLAYKFGFLGNGWQGREEPAIV